MPYITSFERLALVETLQEVILEALSLRFGTLPQGLVDALNQVDDVARLKQLHRSSVTTVSLEEFQSLLSQSAE